jgi:hypothetical protein
MVETRLEAAASTKNDTEMMVEAADSRLGCREMMRGANRVIWRCSKMAWFYGMVF